MLQKLLMTLAVFLSAWVSAQNMEVIWKDSVSIDADNYYGKDVLGYFYYSKNNVLYKQKQAEKLEYKNLSLGKIESVDLINPLKILVFYKEFNAVVLLDNQLSEITKINLNRYNILAQICSMASANRLWAYDNLSNQLMLIDYLNHKTTVLNQPFKNDFTFCQSDYNQWIIVSSNREIISYNNYGNLTILGTTPDFNKIYLTQKRDILFSLNDNLYLYKSVSKTSHQLFSDPKSIANFDYNNEILTLFTGKTIENYQILIR